MYIFLIVHQWINNPDKYRISVNKPLGNSDIKAISQYIPSRVMAKAVNHLI